MLELVSCPINSCQRVTFDESPTISLWPSGSLCAESRISTSFPIKLSVIFFPQSIRAPFMNDAVLDLRVSDEDVVSDARVWSYVGIGSYLAVLSNYHRSAYRGSAVDYCAFADSDVVG